MEPSDWDARYAASEMLWGAEPNRFVAAAFADVTPRGRALDWACGEGRNAVWLAERGWRVTGIDFSRVALERGRELAAHHRVRVDFVRARVTASPLRPARFALVVVSYLQLPRDAMRRALGAAARALAPGGELFAIGHALRNLAHGVGGPQQAAVLWDPEVLRVDLEAAGLAVDRVREVRRPVETDDGVREAIDVEARAHRPPPVDRSGTTLPPLGDGSRG